MKKEEIIEILKKNLKSSSKIAGIEKAAESIINSCNTPCECKQLVHVVECNAYPYGDNIEYDECQECGRIYNLKTF